MTNKYLRTIYGVDTEGNAASLQVDVYDILDAYPTRNPALDHLIKKALCPGTRGHKDLLTDLDDIIKSAQRAKQMAVNRIACSPEIVINVEDVQVRPQSFKKAPAPKLAPARQETRPTAFFGKTLCFYPVKLQAEGMLKTFLTLAEKAGIPTRAVERADHVAPDGFLVDGPEPSENTIRRFIDQGIFLYGVREACAILRGHLTVARDKQDIVTAVRPQSFKNVGTIYVFPDALSDKRLSAITDAAAGICRIVRIDTITEAPAGSVVVGSYREEDKLIEGCHAYSAKEALGILAKDKQEGKADEF